MTYLRDYLDKENIKISKSILSSYFNQDFSDDDLIIEKYNQEYAALSCHSLSFRSRFAKKTPAKKGYFLTIWTKDEDIITVHLIKKKVQNSYL